MIYNLETGKLFIGESAGVKLGKGYYVLHYSFENDGRIMEDIIPYAERYSMFSQFEIDLKETMLEWKVNEAKIIQHHILMGSEDNHIPRDSLDNQQEEKEEKEESHVEESTSDGLRSEK